MKLNYIYGPVSSWRLGRSLGIDLISAEKKVCSFNCSYCQLGLTGSFSKERKVYVETKNIIDEVKSLPTLKADYITFSGIGEPTLAENLGEVIRAVKKLRKEKIAVLTNSSLIDREDVRNDLAEADFVIAKLDAPSQELFEEIDRPVKTIKLNNIIEGIKKFKALHRGRLGLQIMFVEAKKESVKELASIVKDINPDEIEINTPLRPCEVKPLSKREISQIKKYFKGIPCLKSDIVSVYDFKRGKVSSISSEESLKKRGR